jgi:hypothetical protein
MAANNQVQTIKEAEFDENNIVFLDKVDGSVGEGSQKISYCRIPIKYRKKDGTLVDLLVSTGKVRSYGVSANTDQATKAINGYSLTCYLPSGDVKAGGGEKKEAPKGERKGEKIPNVPGSFIEKVCIAVHKKGTEYMIAHAEELGKDDFDADTARALLKSPLVMPNKKSKHKRIYPKLVWFKKTDKREEKMISKFLKVVNFGKPGEPVKMEATDPLGCTGACDVIAAIKFDNIFVGAKIAFQIKVPQCVVMDSAPELPDDLLAGEVAELQKGIHDMTLKAVEDKASSVNASTLAPTKKETPKKASKEEEDEGDDPEKDLGD